MAEYAFCHQIPFEMEKGLIYKYALNKFSREKKITDTHLIKCQIKEEYFFFTNVDRKNLCSVTGHG